MIENELHRSMRRLPKLSCWRTNALLVTAALVAISCSPTSRAFAPSSSRLLHYQASRQTRSTNKALFSQRSSKSSSSSLHPFASTTTSNHGNNSTSSLFSHTTLTPGPAGNVFVHEEPDVVVQDDNEELSTATTAAAAVMSSEESNNNDLIEGILSSYWGPRVILATLAAVYATNFNLGAIMADNLPASAATCARMVLAALALSPALPKLAPDLRWPAILCGCFTSLGYVTQSIALLDTDPARVSFLGSLTVLWCPFLEWLVDKKPSSWKQAPQTWLAALMCLAGIGALELQGDALSGGFAMSAGDGLSILQAVGFGTGVYWTSRMLSNRPDQALPVTATLLATTAFNAMLWCLADGWMFPATAAADSAAAASANAMLVGSDWTQTAALPGLLLNPDMRHVAAAVVWTGLISTSLNFYIELTVLGRVPPSEASVILASEPLWAAIFAAAFMPGSSLTMTDGLGGALIVGACLVNALVTPQTFGWGNEDDADDGAAIDVEPIVFVGEDRHDDAGVATTTAAAARTSTTPFQSKSKQEIY